LCSYQGEKATEIALNNNQEKGKIFKDKIYQWKAAWKRGLFSPQKRTLHEQEAYLQNIFFQSIF